MIGGCIYFLAKPDEPYHNTPNVPKTRNQTKYNYDIKDYSRFRKRRISIGNSRIVDISEEKIIIKLAIGVLGIIGALYVGLNNYHF